MPKPYSSRYIISILEGVGFEFVSQKGSHGKFKRTTSNTVHVVIVPLAKREIPYGTFKSIVRQDGLMECDFTK